MGISIVTSLAILQANRQSCRKRRVYAAIYQLKRDHGLVYLWEHNHQNDPGYTYYSALNQKFSRIDFALVMAGLIANMKIDLLPKVV